MRNYMKSISS